MADERDHIVRAITNDNGFRIVAARTVDTVRQVIAAQSTTGPTATCLGEMVTGAILVRETMAPSLRVQVILQSPDGKGSIVADSHPDGLTRGLARLPDGQQEIEVAGGAMLQVVRTLPNGELHQGVVSVPQQGGVSGALMSYMQQSEQVLSMIAVSCRLGEDDQLVAAGGYVIQVLPELERDALEQMTQRLEAFEALAETLETTASDADATLAGLLRDVPYTRLEESPLRFGCTCDAVRVVSALASLGREEIQSLVDGDRVIDMTCDYCGQQYQVPPAQLRALLTGS